MSPVTKCPDDQYLDAGLGACAQCWKICFHSSTWERCHKNCPNYNVTEKKAEIRKQRRLVRYPAKANRVISPEGSPGLINEQGHETIDQNTLTTGSKGLSSGLVAAIVINILLVIVIIAIVLVVARNRKSKSICIIVDCLKKFKAVKRKDNAPSNPDDVENGAQAKAALSDTESKIEQACTRSESKKLLSNNNSDQNNHSNHNNHSNPAQEKDNASLTQADAATGCAITTDLDSRGFYSQQPFADITPLCSMVPSLIVNTPRTERHLPNVHVVSNSRRQGELSPLQVEDKRSWCPAEPRSYSRDLSSVVNLVSQDYFSSDLRTGGHHSVSNTVMFNGAVEKLRQNRLSVKNVTILHVTIYDDGVDVYVKLLNGSTLLQARRDLLKVMGLRLTQLRLRIDAPPGGSN